MVVAFARAPGQSETVVGEGEGGGAVRARIVEQGWGMPLR